MMEVTRSSSAVLLATQVVAGTVSAMGARRSKTTSTVTGPLVPAIATRGETAGTTTSGETVAAMTAAETVALAGRREDGGTTMRGETGR